MQKNIATFLFALCLSHTAIAQLNKSNELTALLSQIFNKNNVESRKDNLIEKGQWNADNTVYVIAEKAEANTLVYAFIKQKDSGYKSIKLFQIEPEKIHGKLGRPLAYYDRYEIRPNLWAKTPERIIGVSIVTRTWKDGQRYTVESKPVFIRNDGTLDSSHFTGDLRMTEPHFKDGKDETTFAPFVLIDARDQPWADVRLSFNQWDWLREQYGTDEIDGYYLNGYGIQGLVLAARINAGLEAYAEGMEPNSEGDACYIHFSNLASAVETARLAQAMISNEAALKKMITIARENDLED